MPSFYVFKSRYSEEMQHDCNNTSPFLEEYDISTHVYRPYLGAAVCQWVHDTLLNHIFQIYLLALKAEQQ